MLRLLNNPEQTGQFMGALENSAPDAILAIGGFSDKSIPDTSSNVGAVKKMEAENTARLVVVTPDDTLEGVVLRDTIVTRLLVGLAPEDN